jgi:uncharacterized protein (TIGR02145 family)
MTLKEIGNEHWIGPNYLATDETGFRALPAGTYEYYHRFLGYEAYFWVKDDPDIRFQNIHLKNDDSRIFLSWGEFQSVRCIKDD